MTSSALNHLLNWSNVFITMFERHSITPTLTLNEKELNAFTHVHEWKHHGTLSRSNTCAYLDGTGVISMPVLDYSTHGSWTLMRDWPMGVWVLEFGLFSCLKQRPSRRPCGSIPLAKVFVSTVIPGNTITRIRRQCVCSWFYLADQISLQRLARMLLLHPWDI